VGGGTGNISIAIGAAIESAIGGSGADSLIASAFGSTLDGGTGNDTLTCGAGIDTVVFRTGSGADTLIGFAAGNGGDVIDLTGLPSVHNINDIMALATPTGNGGADTLISFGNGDSLTLQGVARTSLTSGNFVFV